MLVSATCAALVDVTHFEINTVIWGGAFEAGTDSFDCACTVQGGHQMLLTTMSEAQVVLCC